MSTGNQAIRAIGAYNVGTGALVYTGTTKLKRELAELL